jgi:acyl-CoA thioester hydrolase
VIEVGLRYLKPARYDEEISVFTACTEASGARVRLDYEVRRGEDLLATGFTRLASIEPSGRPKRMPAELRTAFEAAVAAAKSPAS